MKGLIVNSDGSTELKNMPSPEYGEYQALVEVKSGCFCGTDKKILHNDLTIGSGYPTILGHEGVGVVVEKGSKVRSFEIGDHVLMPTIIGKCGDYFSTWGAFAEYATVGDSEALTSDGYKVDGKIFFRHYIAQKKIPKSIDFVSASMIITFREVYAAYKKLERCAGKSIVVYGGGPVGLIFIKFAKLLGLNPVISVVNRDEKIELAKEAGADIVFNIKKCDIVPEIWSICRNGIDITVDAAGAAELINTSLRIISENGHICVYGVIPERSMEIDWAKAPVNWNLMFYQQVTAEERAAVHDEIVKWMLEGKLNGSDFISNIFSFDEILDAIKLLESKKFNKKIAIRF